MVAMKVQGGCLPTTGEGENPLIISLFNEVNNDRNIQQRRNRCCDEHD